MRRTFCAVLGLGVVLCLLVGSPVWAHGVHSHDADFITTVSGAQPFPFMYLGAKHMVTGYDHLAYLAGVIFFLGRIKDVFKYVSLFAVGHSLTLMTGVLLDIHVNPYLIDAIIGLSVCYKALENLGVLRFPAKVGLSPEKAVFGFGLIHGFGLSSKLQDLDLNPEGLIANMLAFNAGVEIGQILALTFLLGLFFALRVSHRFDDIALAVNMGLLTCGLVLFGMQITGYFVGAA